MADSKDVERGYMSDDISFAGLGVGALSIVSAILLALLIGFVVIRHGRDQPLFAARYRHPPQIAGPVTLQPAPDIDIARFREEKRQALQHYEWIDRENGIARIPIERAMALLARRAGGSTVGP